MVLKRAEAQLPLFQDGRRALRNPGRPGVRAMTGSSGSIAFAFTQLLLCVPIIYVNRSYYSRGFSALARRAPNMDSLIAIGSSAALVYGIFAIYRMGYGLGTGDMALVEKYHMSLYFESGAMILALITIGKYLEARSKGKTSRAITRLVDMTPKTALAIREGIEEEIPVEDVMPGDILRVKPGSAIPVDGVVTEGMSLTATLAAVAVIGLISSALILLGPDLNYAFLDYIPEPYTQTEADLIFISEILMGGLGVIMDIAVTITATSSELIGKNPGISRKSLLESCRQVGDDITGAMINVVFFTNVASVMPLFILSMRNDISFVTVIKNNTFFETARFLTGAIGIIITIPLSILAASFFIRHGKRGEQA